VQPETKNANEGDGHRSAGPAPSFARHVDPRPSRRSSKTPDHSVDLGRGTGTTTTATTTATNRNAASTRTTTKLGLDLHNRAPLLFRRTPEQSHNAPTGHSQVDAALAHQRSSSLGDENRRTRTRKDGATGSAAAARAAAKLGLDLHWVTPLYLVDVSQSHRSTALRWRIDDTFDVARGLHLRDRKLRARERRSRHDGPGDGGAAAARTTTKLGLDLHISFSLFWV